MSWPIVQSEHFRYWIECSDWLLFLSTSIKINYSKKSFMPQRPGHKKSVYNGNNAFKSIMTRRPNYLGIPNSYCMQEKNVLLMK
jgi:hypothetical protein